MKYLTMTLGSLDRIALVLEKRVKRSMKCMKYTLLNNEGNLKSIAITSVNFDATGAATTGLGRNLLWSLQTVQFGATLMFIFFYSDDKMFAQHIKSSVA